MAAFSKGVNSSLIVALLARSTTCLRVVPKHQAGDEDDQYMRAKGYGFAAIAGTAGSEALLTLGAEHGAGLTSEPLGGRLPIDSDRYAVDQCVRDALGGVGGQPLPIGREVSEAAQRTG